MRIPLATGALSGSAGTANPFGPDVLYVWSGMTAGGQREAFLQAGVKSARKKNRGCKGGFV